ncbi:MAG: HEAT repeat domain-containing protein [Chloroflexota bacterium]
MSNIRPERYTEKKSIAENSEPFSEISKQLQKEIESIICVVADKKSIPALISLLDDSDFEIRWIAAESLIRIGRKSIQPLLQTISDGKQFSHPRKAYHVLQCLLTSSEKRSLHPLLATLSHNRGNVLTRAPEEHIKGCSGIIT